MPELFLEELSPSSPALPYVLRVRKVQVQDISVSCDACLRSNFKGRRYKCLICYDYDLCATCFETGAASSRHLSSHAMQCMLPRAEYELYYSGESGSLSSEIPLSLTCPYCAKVGLTEGTLYDHVCCDHADVAIEVVCPICASQPGGEPNNVVMDFVAHIQREHRSTQDDSHLQSHERQQPRRMPSRGAVTNGSTALGRGRGAHGRGPFGSAPLSPRDSTMESITEILSQLSAAGRRNNHNGQNSSSAQHTIHQLQMQLDRHGNIQVSRQQDKGPRRGTTGSSLSGQNHLELAMSAGSMSGGITGMTLPSGRLPINTGQDNNGSGSGSGTTNSQYLLTRYLNAGSKQRCKKKGPSSASPDRAQFVENLLLNTLLPNSSLLRARASQLAGDKSEDFPVKNLNEDFEYNDDSGPEEEPSDGLEAIGTPGTANSQNINKR